MADHWAERTWRPFGANNPYYGVCNDDAFRGVQLDAAASAAFFASGREHAAWVRSLVEAHLTHPFEPRRVLDFGCGVGRVLLAIAEGAERAVGVDVSPEMLAEAGRNAARAGLPNVELVSSDDALAAVTGEFDFVHSFIVFQHIPPRRGERIAAGLLARLAPGGVAALHFTYHRNAPLYRRAVHRIRRASPAADALARLVRGAGREDVFIPMYEYSLGRLAEMFRARGCTDVHAFLTDHGGHRGVLLLARVP